MFQKFRENIEIYINYVIILFAIVIPLNRGLSNFFLDLALILFLFLPDLKNRLQLLFKNKIFKIFLLFIFYNILVLFWTDDKIDGIKYVFQYFRYFLIFVFALSIQEKYLKYIISAFLFGIFISEITAYGIYFKFWDTAFHSAHVAYNDLTPFMNHIMYTIFLAVGIFSILIQMFFDRLSIKEKIFLFLFFTTMTINIFMSGGRGGQVAFFITFLVIIIYNVVITKSYKYLLILTIPVVLFLLGYNFSGLFHQRIDKGIKDLLNVINHLHFCGSMGQRLGAWIVSYEILKDPIYLIFGMGFKEPMLFLHNLIHTSEFSYLRCLDHNYSHFHLHNVYLMKITQTGLIGLILYLLFLYKIIKIDTKSLYWNNIKVAFFSIFLISSLVEPIFHHTWTANLFLLFTSIFLYFDLKKSAT